MYVERVWSGVESRHEPPSHCCIVDSETMAELIFVPGCECFDDANIIPEIRPRYPWMWKISISVGSVSAVASKRVSLGQVRPGVVPFAKLKYVLSAKC
jgi:hypothetical protein